MAVQLPIPRRYRAARREAEPRDVAEVQEYLRAVSFEEPSVPRIAVDGRFGSETTQAVLAFQRLRGLTETGRVDRITWDALYADWRASAARRAPPEGVRPFAGGAVDLGAGDGGDAVVLLQVMLAFLSSRFENLPDAAVTGVYDEATARSVAGFQRACALEDTGRVDKCTWDLLVRTYNSYMREHRPISSNS